MFVTSGDVQCHRVHPLHADTSLLVAHILRMSIPYIGDNQFETVDDMVNDGLIALFMEEHNAEEYIDQGTKLARRPAVYTRRRNAHILKYQMGRASSLKENSGDLRTLLVVYFPLCALVTK